MTIGLKDDSSAEKSRDVEATRLLIAAPKAWSDPMILTTNAAAVEEVVTVVEDVAVVLRLLLCHAPPPH